MPASTNEPTGDRSANAIPRIAVAVVPWVVACAVLLVAGVSAKETCSAAVGSVPSGPGGRLLLPCDLIGWVEATAVVGGALILIVASILGAWRRWSHALTVGAAMLAMPLIALCGLNATNVL